jgi:hypothetical protein
MNNLSTKRIDRKNITYKEIGYKSSGGMFDLVDNAIKETLRINDDQYNYLCEVCEDNQLDLLVRQDLSFREKKDLLVLLENKLTEFNNK